MAERKPKWPEAGDQITAIQAFAVYGAYAKLDEYDKRRWLNVSLHCCLKHHKNLGQGILRREE